MANLLVHYDYLWLECIFRVPGFGGRYVISFEDQDCRGIDWVERKAIRFGRYARRYARRSGGR